MNRELPMLGDILSEVKEVDEGLIRICESVTDAVNICLQVSGMTQRAIAKAIFIDESYLSYMLRGKRHWTDPVLLAITARTRCAAILQYQASRIGRKVTPDPIALEEAALEARLVEVRARKQTHTDARRAA